MIILSDKRVILIIITIVFSFIIYYVFYTPKNNERFDKIMEFIVTIQFNDPTFYNEIKNQINTHKQFNDEKLTITLFKNDIKSITSLRFSNSEIKDISGIKYFTALKELVLQNSNYLTDISELSYLNELEILKLNNNKLLSDFSPLENLTNLDNLDF